MRCTCWALQSFKRSREASVSAAASSTAAASENLFDGFAADIYRAHVSVEHRRFARTGADSAARNSDREDSEGEGEGSAPYPSADSHRSSSSALPSAAGLHSANGKTKTRPTDTDSLSSPGRATRRRTGDGRGATSVGVDDDSDDSDPEMAALFAAESTTASGPTAATQGQGQTLGLLDMASEDYQPPSQRRGDGVAQHASHAQHRHRAAISPAVSAPRPAAGSSQLRPSPAGSSTKKIKKKKRNRKVI